MRSTPIGLAGLAGASAALGVALSGLVNFGVATPVIVVVAVVALATILDAGARRAAGTLDMQSEHGTFWRELARELDRSRRHECQFALARILADQSRAQDLIAAIEANLPTRPSRAGALVAYVRSSDRIWEDADGHLFILMPETERAEAERVLSRIAGAAPDLLPPSNIRIVMFPENGLTSGALIAALNDPTRPPLVTHRVQGDAGGFASRVAKPGTGRGAA